MLKKLQVETDSIQSLPQESLTMLLIIHEVFITFWNSSDRSIRNSLVTVFLPLILIIVYRLLTRAIYRYSLNSLPLRNLRGKTIIFLTYSLDSAVLELVQELAKRGVQLLIALPNSRKDPINLQLILLLRQPENESIFLDDCSLESADDTLRFARQWLSAVQSPIHTSRLDSIILLSHPTKPDQSFLLFNILLPYLINQLQTGPPTRVIPLNSSPENLSLWRTFQHHLGPNPPLVFIPSPRSTFNCLWAILAPLSDITSGLLHLNCKPSLNQQPLDEAKLEEHLKSVESIIRTTIDSKK